MTLSDAKFLNPAPVADEPRPDFKTALRGVGDPLRRSAADFYAGFKGQALPPNQEAFQVGDTVEYTTPDNITRVGSLMRPQDGEWLVRIDEGEVHRVPQAELRPSLRTPRHAHRAAMQTALHKTSAWKMRRQPEAQGEHIHLTVDVGNARIDESQVMAFTASRGLKAVDAAREGNLLRIVAQELPQPSPSEPTGGEMPGIETEEIQGTGMPFSAVLREAGYQLGAQVDDGARITVPFNVPARYLDGNRVTATLAEGVAPLSGYFEYNPATGALRRFVHTAEGTVETPYASGTGPESTREDYSSGLDDGDYVVKAVDQKSKSYFSKYYGPYGKMLTRDMKRRKPRASDEEIIDAFDEEPSELELQACRAVLASADVTMVRQAQMVSGKDIVMTLMRAGTSDPSVQKQLDRAVLAAIGKSPSEFLNKIDSTVYPRILYGAIQGASGRKLLRLYRGIAEEGGAADPDFGSPGLFEDRDPEATAREYLAQEVEGFENLAPAAQTQLVQQALSDPPPDLAAKLQGPESAKVVVPQTSRRKPLMDRAREVGQGIRDRLPGGTRQVERMQRQVDQEEADEDYARNMRETVEEQIDEQRRSGAVKHPALGDQVRPKLDRVTSQGSYLCVRLVWDPDECEQMSDGSIKHNVVTWMKGLATLKEDHPDLGTLGRPRFKTFDPDAGLAELLIRSSNADAFPQEVATVSGEDNDVRA